MHCREEPPRGIGEPCAKKAGGRGTHRKTDAGTIIVRRTQIPDRTKKTPERQKTERICVAGPQINGHNHHNAARGKPKGGTKWEKENQRRNLRTATPVLQLQFTATNQNTKPITSQENQPPRALASSHVNGEEAPDRPEVNPTKTARPGGGLYDLASSQLETTTSPHLCAAWGRTHPKRSKKDHKDPKKTNTDHKDPKRPKKDGAKISSVRL